MPNLSNKQTGSSVRARRRLLRELAVILRRMSPAREASAKGPALKPPSVRLFVLLARGARRAVVFRRGPSKQVLLLSWDTATDAMTPGQWFRGRIYERRCDLSPSGDKLAYFAAKYRGEFGTWTAVSRPPWLTALALWPHGDAWGGGGLFESDQRLLLNHRSTRMQLAPDFQLPKRFLVEPLGPHAGRGEDFPIYDQRLQRDGWRLLHPGAEKRHASGEALFYSFDPAITYRRVRPGGRAPDFELQMRITGIHEREGAWYVVEYDLIDLKREQEVPLGRLDWADWDSQGDLLFAREGRLYRLEPQRRGNTVDVSQPHEVVDLRDLTFENRKAPPGVTQW